VIKLRRVVDPSRMKLNLGNYLFAAKGRSGIAGPRPPLNLYNNETGRLGSNLGERGRAASPETTIEQGQGPATLSGVKGPASLRLFHP
jgi:hypothetical protein